ncbi:MAG TPA: hypothetical protein VLN26_05505 [Gaiellaceae bacterium]|nr:hypothetical protein [Gaiellaceae bacterium]
MNTLIIVNGILMLGIVAALFAVVGRVHGALSSDSTAASSWGLDQQGVPSDPLPLEAILDRERELARAA